MERRRKGRAEKCRDRGSLIQTLSKTIQSFLNVMDKKYTVANKKYLYLTNENPY